MKRRELQKQAHIPVYDYDKKFQYSKQYLRDDRIPAFISTKAHQTHKKEADLENVDSILGSTNNNEIKHNITTSKKQ